MKLLNSFFRLLSYCKKYILIIIITLVFSTGAIFAGMTVPYLTKEIIDNVLMVKEFERLNFFVGMLIIAAVIKGVTMYIRSYLFQYASQRIVYDFRSQIYDRLQAQSFEFYDKMRTGLLMNRVVGDLNAIRQFISMGYLHIFESIVSFVSTFVIMLSLSVELTLVVVIILPFVYFNTSRMSKLLYPVFSGIRTAFEDLTSRVQENVSGIRVIKGMGREDFEKEKFEKVARDFTLRNIGVSEIRAKHQPLSQLLNGMGLVIILLFGGYLAIKGKMSVGTLVAFNSYMFMLNNPINNLSNIVNEWQNAAASMDKVFALLDAKPAIKNKENAKTLSVIKGNIVFKNVYFKYNDTYVLKNINLNMRAGSTTAIMGATGSGKSTIINLIARFYDADKGRVKIDGFDVRDLEMNNLRRHIGIILQETFLFSDTIANNISFGRPDASFEEIERAAKIADAYDFIMEMPQKYNTVIGERGVGLSGGQKQRIAIARAVLCNPEILILDDATSSVDMETEQEIQNTLKQVMKGRTTLIIAHRISSVRDADHIIYLHEGEIIEEGSHDELIEQKGQYYNTFIEQCYTHGSTNNQLP